jgi:hypothetical protein
VLGGAWEARFGIGAVDFGRERLCRGPELSACEVGALLAERNRYSRALHPGILCT